MTDLVEQPTGWPRHECHALIRMLSRRHRLTASVLPAIAGFAFFWAWIYSYGGAMQALEDRGLNLVEWAQQTPWLGIPLLLGAGLGFALIGCAVVHIAVGRYWFRRHIARYLASPACLTCQYPITPEAGRCPECGNAIPTHLAEWAQRLQ